MSKLKFKMKRGSLGSSVTKVGAGVATNYLMVYADKTIPVLAKNKFVTPLIVYLASLGVQVTAKPDTFASNAADGVNIISGVDLVNAFVDMGQTALAQNNATTPDANADATTVGKTKNPTVPYQNWAR